MTLLPGDFLSCLIFDFFSLLVDGLRLLCWSTMPSTFMEAKLISLTNIHTNRHPIPTRCYFSPYLLGFLQRLHLGHSYLLPQIHPLLLLGIHSRRTTQPMPSFSEVYQTPTHKLS